MGVLEDYADKVAGKAPPEWRRPTMEDFRTDFKVLSFDQSLNTTGWVYLEVTWNDEGRLIVHVRAKGTIRTKSELKSHEEYFDRQDQLLDVLNEEMHEAIDHPVEAFPDAVLLERPSIFGKRKESSLLAASTIRRYCYTWWKMPMLMSIQHARTVLAGSGTRDDKKAGHEALAEYLPESVTRKWNEHERDGAINALAHLHDLKAAG